MLDEYNNLLTECKKNKYKDLISFYTENLLNQMFLKYELSLYVSNITQKEQQILWKDLLELIKKLHFLLKDENKLKELQKHYHNWNYNNEEIFEKIYNISIYFQKYPPDPSKLYLSKRLR